MSGIDRIQHLAWCKERALELLDEGDLGGAVSSMVSDLTKHPETARMASQSAPDGMLQIGKGGDAVRRWIEGLF